MKTITRHTSGGEIREIVEDVGVGGYDRPLRGGGNYEYLVM